MFSSLNYYFIVFFTRIKIKEYYNKLQAVYLIKYFDVHSFKLGGGGGLFCGQTSW